MERKIQAITEVLSRYVLDENGYSRASSYMNEILEIILKEEDDDGV